MLHCVAHPLERSLIRRADSADDASNSAHPCALLRLIGSRWEKPAAGAAPQFLFVRIVHSAILKVTAQMQRESLDGFRMYITARRWAMCDDTQS
jgi:hypothetical protein